MAWAKPYLLGLGLPVGHQLAPSSRHVRVGQPGGGGVSWSPQPSCLAQCSVNGTSRQCAEGSWVELGGLQEFQNETGKANSQQ